MRGVTVVTRIMNVDEVARYLGVYDGLLATGRPADLRGERLRCAE